MVVGNVTNFLFRLPRRVMLTCVVSNEGHFRERVFFRVIISVLGSANGLQIGNMKFFVGGMLLFRGSAIRVGRGLGGG